MSVAEQSRAEIVGASFRERVRAAGGTVVGDAATDQETLRRAHVTLGAKTDTRPAYVEIDAGEGEREIVIRERDGTAHRLHPMLTYGNAKKMSFYQKQFGKLASEVSALEEGDDEAAYFAALERASVMEEKIMRLAIPDFPTGLLDRLETNSLRQLQEAAQAMQGGSDDSPNEPSRDGDR